MSERYYRNQEDFQNEAYVRRLNAETEAQKQAMNQAIYEQQNSFLDPINRVSPSGEAPGFGQSFGTGAGGNAYIMGMDYGINAGAPDVSGRQQYPGMQQIEAPQFEPIKELENIDGLTNKYYENTSLLNQISKTAARAGFNIKDPDPMNADERNMANYYNELLEKTKMLGSKLNEGYRIREDMSKNPEKYRATGMGAGISRPTRYQDVYTTELHPVVKEFNDGTEQVYYDYNAWKAKTQEAKALKAKFKAWADASDNYQQRAKYLEDMNAITLPEYDASKVAERALEQQKINDARNRVPAGRFGVGVKEGDLANLKELIFRAREHGDVGILAQDLPEAKVVEDESGKRFLVFKPKNGLGDDNRVDLDNEEAVASAIIENNPKFGKVTLGDVQAFNDMNPDWKPREEINYRVVRDMKVYDKLFSDFETAQEEGDSDKEAAARDKFLKAISPLLVGNKFNRKTVSDVLADDPGFTGTGADNAVIKYSDGTQEVIDLNDEKDAIKLAIKEGNIGAVSGFAAKNTPESGMPYYSKKYVNSQKNESGPKEGDEKSAPSGKTVIFRDGKWQLK